VRYLLIIIVLWGGAAFAQDNESLRVGVYVSPPFVMKAGENHHGMAIDLWELLADNTRLKYNYLEYDSPNALVEALDKGAVDVAVTNLTVTHDRAKDIAFTYPWHDAGLRILINYEDGSVWEELKNSGQMPYYLCFFALIILLAVGRTFLRRRMDAKFTKKWKEGITLNVFEVLQAAKYGTVREEYLGWLGYVFAAVWLIFGVGVVAYITSSVTTVMTTSSLKSSIHSVYDLPEKEVGVLAGSVAEDYLLHMNVHVIPFESMEDAAVALLDKNVEAVVADSPVLEYWEFNHTEQPFDVIGNTFHPDKYAFGVSKTNRELLDSLSLELIRLHEAGEIENLREHYLGVNE
jgi:ABC-type amino acid transport substrate-binding protein